VEFLEKPNPESIRAARVAVEDLDALPTVVRTVR